MHAVRCPCQLGPNNCRSTLELTLLLTSSVVDVPLALARLRLAWLHGRGALAVDDSLKLVEHLLHELLLGPVDVMQLHYDAAVDRIRVVHVFAADLELAPNLLLEAVSVRQGEYNLTFAVVEACTESFDELFVLPGLGADVQCAMPPIGDRTSLLITSL